MHTYIARQIQWAENYRRRQERQCSIPAPHLRRRTVADSGQRRWDCGSQVTDFRQDVAIGCLPE